MRRYPPPFEPGPQPSRNSERQPIRNRAHDSTLETTHKPRGDSTSKPAEDPAEEPAHRTDQKTGSETVSNSTGEPAEKPPYDYSTHEPAGNSCYQSGRVLVCGAAYEPGGEGDRLRGREGDHESARVAGRP